MTQVRYSSSDEAWVRCSRVVQELVSPRHVTRVCEVGGGANPALSPAVCQAHGLEYVLLDISATELAKAPAGYATVEADIASPSFTTEGGFDLVFSKMLAEHVPDGAMFHANVRKLLRPGGLAFHFFPTLYSTPFFVNWMVPDRVASALLARVQPERTQDSNHAKFPAKYDLCRGPTPRQIERLEALGYEVLEYVGFFGHEYYRRLGGLELIHRALAEWLISHPIASVTSFAQVLLRRR
jgi:2-polyprenyl-3-methyl-5-hydroxy-6-metoxy-1,4-benzoquinol methylase